MRVGCKRSTFGVRGLEVPDGTRVCLLESDCLVTGNHARGQEPWNILSWSRELAGSRPWRRYGRRFWRGLRGVLFADGQQPAFAVPGHSGIYGDSGCDLARALPLSPLVVELWASHDEHRGSLEAMVRARRTLAGTSGSVGSSAARLRSGAVGSGGGCGVDGSPRLF
jgi:hypothetical protein